MNIYTVFNMNIYTNDKKELANIEKEFRKTAIYKKNRTRNMCSFLFESILFNN